MRLAEFIVTGRVQGVGFRFHTQKRARELGLTGWVKNLPDGTVSILVEGPNDNVSALIDWCRVGPATAIVTDLRIEKDEMVPSTFFPSFEVA